jgi:ankyrin repeat protein
VEDLDEALSSAIRKCHTVPPQFQTAKDLIERGAKISPKDTKIWTLFILAIYKDKNEPDDITQLKNSVAKLLVEKGLDAKARQKPGNETPLLLAAHAGNIVIAQYLVEEKKADVNAKDAKKRTPLHFAMEKINPELTNYLKSCGANINAKDKRGRKPGDKTIEHMASDSPMRASPTTLPHQPKASSSGPPKINL